MKKFTKSHALVLLIALFTFQACDKEIAETTATKEKQLAAVDEPNTVSIIAGSTQADGYGDVNDGPALQATFGRISDIDVAEDGTVYISDENLIRKLKDGVVSTIARPTRYQFYGGLGGYHAAISKDGILFVTGNGDLGSSLAKITPDGTFTKIFDTKDYRNPGNERYQDGPLETAKFEDIKHIAIGLDGSLYVSDFRRLRKITPDGIVSTLKTFEKFKPGDTFSKTICDLTITDDGSLYYIVEKQKIDALAHEYYYSIEKLTPQGSEVVFESNNNGFPTGLTSVGNSTLYFKISQRHQIISPKTKTQYAVIAGKLNNNKPGPEEGPAEDVVFSRITNDFLFGKPNTGIDYYKNAIHCR